MKVLIGMTGSVASILAPKIVKAISEVTIVEKIAVVMTEKAQSFMPASELHEETGVNVYTEKDEWTWKHRDFTVNNRWQKNDPVLHIELAKEFNVLLIAPITANTIAKMASGIVDNLLLSVYSAWRNPYVIIAPAMNSFMWNSISVKKNIAELKSRGILVINPAIKKLACGDYGQGALADLEIITHTIKTLKIY